MLNSKFRTLYIGTYTRHESHVDGHAEGIYVYQFDLANGQLRYQSTMTGLVNPSFVTVEPRGKFLYAVNELTREEEVSGAVSAFIIDPATGNLAFLNKQPTKGIMDLDISYPVIVHDTIFYTFYIVDRTFNRSNTDTTDVIVLSGITLNEN